MAKAKAVQSFSCPVCHEDLKEPKILPCTHLVCRECVLSTLKKKKKKRRSGKSGCPECQIPLFKSDTLDQDDFDSFVDELPTDHATAVKVECQKTLTGSNVCTICDNSSEAESFCFECDTKLCSSCRKVHSKLPSSSNHTVEKLSSLTAEQLAAKKWIPCCSHKEKSAELYCSEHEDLVCYLCATSGHRACGVMEITSAAENKRQELEEQKKRLTDKQASLSAEIKDCDSLVTKAEAKFAEMRDRVIKVFSDLIKSLEDQKQKLLGEIRQKEQIFLDEKLANKKELEAVRSSAEAHVHSVDVLLSTGSDQAFLVTSGGLNPRLNEVESEEAVTHDNTTIGDVYFDENVLSGLKRTAANTGEVRDSPPEQDKSRLIHCYTCNAISVTEGTFHFVIEKPERGSPVLMSQPCIIRNMPWRLDVRPWCEDKEHLGLYLQNDVSSKSKSWSCKVKSTFRLLKVNDTHGTFERPETKDTFNSSEPAWGRPDFIAMNKLLDPNNGYLKDDKLTFEVHIAADAPEGTW